MEGPNEGIKVAAEDDPGELTSVYNQCPQEGMIPAAYKRAKLVLLPKKWKSKRDIPSWISSFPH